MKTLFNLPEKVIFCKKCVLSNQRASSILEFKHQKKRKGAKYLNIDPKTGVCDPCKFHEKKSKINWDKREKKLLQLLDKHRSKNGDYDCIVPGSGGKDSAYASHILKYKYGMNPLTITWSPIMYTDYGYANYKNWIEIGGFDNLLFKQNGRVLKKLTKLSIQNLLHPFQPFILGQKILSPKIAKKFNLPLVFYGESNRELASLTIGSDLIMSKSEYYLSNYKNIYLAGTSIEELIDKHALSLNDLKPYLPIQKKELGNFKFNIHYLGYYLRWNPQEIYYYAVENTGFKPRPFRTQGSYQKYASIDDKIDDLHYYTTYIKFGIGRATIDSSPEIRNRHLTRDEAKTLVNRFDGEFPDKYFNDILDFLDMKNEEFHEICDKFRPDHLWKKTSNGFKLCHTVNNDGEDD